MERNCLFCKIVAGEIPGSFVYRDDEIVAIEDVNPQAPTHLLIIPIEHAVNLSRFVEAAPPALVAKLFGVVGRLGRDLGLEEYRAVVNTGPTGGQTVGHLHVHLLAGRQMHWPPG